MFKSFKNFVEEKSLVGDPKTKLIADYDGDNANTPPTEGKKKAGSPYKPANNAKDPNKKLGKGLADAGDSKLVYDPQTEKQSDLGSYPKIKTEQFLKKTKKMSPAQFVEHITKQNSKHKNYKLIENLIYESKRNGTLKTILECALTLPESYTILAELLNDTKMSNKLARALDEQVGPPMGMDDNMMSNKRPNKKSPMGDDQMGGMDDDESEDDMDGMNQDDSDDDMDGMDDDQSDDDMDGMDDDDDMDQDGSDDMDGMDDSDDDNSDDDMGGMDDDESDDDHVMGMKHGGMNRPNPMMNKNRF